MCPDEALNILFGLLCRFVQILLLTLHDMAHQCAWLPESLSSDAYMSVGHQWLSSKQYANSRLPAYVNQSSVLRRGCDIGSSTDSRIVVANAQQYLRNCDRRPSTASQMSRNECQTLSSCGGVSSPPIQELQWLTSTDSVRSDADSVGETVVTEPIKDHPGRLPEIRSEMQATYNQTDVSADDFDSTVQPLGDSSVCGVCGDAASGFHCGAYICEACKVKT